MKHVGDRSCRDRMYMKIFATLLSHVLFVTRCHRKVHVMLWMKRAQGVGEGFLAPPMWRRRSTRVSAANDVSRAMQQLIHRAQIYKHTSITYFNYKREREGWEPLVLVRYRSRLMHNVYDSSTRSSSVSLVVSTELEAKTFTTLRNELMRFWHKIYSLDRTKQSSKFHWNKQYCQDIFSLILQNEHCARQIITFLTCDFFNSNIAGTSLRLVGFVNWTSVRPYWRKSVQKTATWLIIEKYTFKFEWTQKVFFVIVCDFIQFIGVLLVECVFCLVYLHSIDGVLDLINAMVTHSMENILNMQYHVRSSLDEASAYSPPSRKRRCSTKEVWYLFRNDAQIRLAYSFVLFYLVFFFFNFSI